MNDPDNRGRRRPMGLALVLSASLHWLVVLLLFVVGRSGRCTTACTLEVNTLVVESAAAAQRAAEQPPPVLAAASQSAAMQVLPGGLGGEETGAESGGTMSDSASLHSVPEHSRTLAAPAKSVVFVVDHSASMGLHNLWPAARSAALATLEQLPATTRFQIIAYNRRPDALVVAGRVELLPATAENRQRAVRFLEKLRPEGSTDPLPALKQALLLRPEVIYFLTDAPELRPEQARLVFQWNGGRTRIQTLEMLSRTASR